MTENIPNNDRVYAGPSKTIEILGKGNAYGWIGSLTGLVGGGVFSAISTRQSGKWTQKATDLFKSVGINIDGKWAIIAGGALLGSQILHLAGVAVGLRQGQKNAGAGQDQFERITEENDALRKELKEVKAECSRTHLKLGDKGNVAVTEDAPSAIRPRGSYADALSNEQAATGEITR